MNNYNILRVREKLIRLNYLYIPCTTALRILSDIGTHT